MSLSLSLLALEVSADSEALMMLSCVFLSSDPSLEEDLAATVISFVSFSSFLRASASLSLSLPEETSLTVLASSTPAIVAGAFVPVAAVVDSGSRGLLGASLVASLTDGEATVPESFSLRCWSLT